VWPPGGDYASFVETPPDIDTNWVANNQREHSNAVYTTADAQARINENTESPFSLKKTD
jgi:hypothetical protein